MAFTSTLRVRVGRRKPDPHRNRIWWEPSDPTPQVNLASIARIYFRRIGICSDASQTGSRLIHWSIYEEAALKDHLTTATFKKIEPLLYNLLPPARRYANRRRSFGTDETARNKTLEEFCSALLNRGPFPPLALGAAKVCRKIDKACQAHRRWKHFSDAEKTVVKDFIAYNTGDCRASWLIAKRLGNAYKKHVR